MSSPDSRSPSRPLRAPALAFFSLALMLSSCPHYKYNTPPPTGSVNFIYTANAAANSGTAALISNATTGALTTITGSPFPAGGSSFALTADPGGKFLYVANYASGDISEFSINQTTGALTQLSSSPVPAEIGVDALAIDPLGRFLYAVSERSANLYQYSIDSSGALHPLASSPVLISAGSAVSRAVAISPSGNFLFVTNEDSTTDNLYVFPRDLVAGTLSPPLAPLAIDSGAHAITADPAGRFVLVASSGSSTLFGNLSVFTYNSATGMLTALPSSPFHTGADPSSVAVDPSSKFVYTANTASSTISAFLISSNTLTEIGGSPFPGGGLGTPNGPTGIATDPSGRFVYACNASNDISAFLLNAQTGALTQIAGSPFPSGASGPHGITVVMRK